MKNFLHLKDSFRVLFLCMAFFCIQTQSWGQLAQWELNGLTAYGASPLAPTSSNANVTVIGLTRGSGFTTINSAAGNAWGGNGHDTTSESAAITANDFATFSITPNTGFTMSLTSIAAYNIRRSGSGSTTGQWQYRIGAGSFVNIGSAITWGANTTATGNLQAAITLSGITELQNLPQNTNVTFRLVLWGGTAAGGNWYFNQFQAGSDLIINGTTAVSNNNAPTASNVAFTGNLQVGSTLTGTYTYGDTEGNLESGTTFQWYRADNAAGLNQTAIGGATNQTYNLTGAELNKFIRFAVTPRAATGTINGTETFSNYSVSAVTSVNNSLSTITVDPGFTPSTNVNYASSLGTDVLPTSFEIAKFSLNDVPGGTDDGFTTKLTSLQFSLSNFAAIEKVALYDDTNTEIQELTSAATLNFTPLTIEAVSGASKLFSVRVTFKAIVTDNVQPQLTITSATADSAGSLFAAPNAGGASSSVAGNDNRIEVTASQLAYVQNATTTLKNAVMTPSVTVRAIDANNNLDLDFTSNIDITSTGTLSVSPTTKAAVAGVATFDNIVHTQPGVGLQLSAVSGAFSPILSTTFDVIDPLFLNPITGTNPNTSNPYTTGQVVNPNITVSGIGRGGTIVGTNANDRYNANTWNVPSFDPNKYFYFTLTPNASYEIDFSNLVYTAQISSGLNGFAVRSSVDNYTTDIGTATAATSPGALVTIDLSGAQFQNITTAITFRIYGWGATSNTSTYSINNFTFNGSVVASAVPSLTANPTSLTNLDYLNNAGPSASQSFTVNGGNLSPSDDVVNVVAPTNFEVSTDNVNFSPDTTINYTGGTITNVPVYVRLVSGLPVGNYNGTITVSGGTADDVTVNVQGRVRVPFAIPYFNNFRTQVVYDDAIAQGFVLNSTTFNPTGYVQVAANGYIETPVIDFTQLSTFQIGFDGATFGGNTGQTLQLQISIDGGATYSPLQTVTYLSNAFVTTKVNVDFANYPSVTGRLRIQMTAGTNTTRFRDFYITNITTWDGAAWSNGTPNATALAIIEGDYNTADNGELVAKNLTVNSGNVTVASTTAVNLQDELTVNGGFVSFENNANLLQVNNATNTGVISIERDALMRRQDYVYWSSPVVGQNLLAFSPETLTNRFYTMNETTNNFASVDPALNSFVAGTGYSIRAPNTFPNTPQTFAGLFEGVPHNGSFTVPVTRNNQGYNLIGNPYPSPISATAFATANPTIGTLYFWTHTSQGAASGANYATFNGTGAAAPAGSEVPNGTIQVGQGFLINVPALTTNVFFNNLMRVDNQQNQFFRAAATETTPEKNRIWLNLTNATTNFNQTLLGYVDGATNELDVNFDGKLIESQNAALYNVINEEAYVIQGKALPFADTDEVNLGFKADMDGTFTITLDHVDGLFAGEQSVFLKDNLTGIIHNIKESAYTFASNGGTFNSRFQVVYQAAPLGVENPGLDSNNIIVFKQNQTLTINSGSIVMKSVKVFDVRGQQLFENNKVNATTSNINLNVSNQVLIVQITSEDNKTVSKKVVY